MDQARQVPDSQGTALPSLSQAHELDASSPSGVQHEQQQQTQQAQTTQTPRPPPHQVPRNIYAVRNGGSYKAENRTIVVCLDGTGDKFDDDNSSIVHLVSCLKKSSPNQITYYQSGIGTYDGGGLSNGFNAALDMAVGSGLGVHVRDAYQFLMQNYQQGDKICLFGFSRGAYTARCLAGMVHKVGLLPANNTAQIPFAYQYYKDDTPKGWTMSEEFKRTFCMDVSVYFLGVFDSVASVGFIPRKLPLSGTPKNKAAYFRHAMALDERRAKFKACRYQAKSSIFSNSWEIEAEEQDAKIEHEQTNGATNGAAGQVNGAGTEHKKHILKKPAGGIKDTDVLEVWFAGCHCDVGGGAVKNEQRHKLSQIPLRWMIRQCFECDTGIMFKSASLIEEGLDIQNLYPTFIPPSKPSEDAPAKLRERFHNGNLPPIRHRSAVLSPVNADNPHGPHTLNIWKDDERQELSDVWVPEQAEDYFDAVQPIFDQLEIAKTWWVLEVMPIKVRIQPENSDAWVKKVRMNLGRRRPVQEKSPNLHWTVEERMRAKGYEIKARVERGASWNIVA